MATITHPNRDGRSLRDPQSGSPPQIYVARPDPDPDNGVIEADLADEPPHSLAALPRQPDAVFLRRLAEPQRRFVPPSPDIPDEDESIVSEPDQGGHTLSTKSHVLFGLISDALGIHFHFYLSHKARRVLVRTLGYVLVVIALLLIGKLPEAIELLIRLIF